MTAVGQDRKFAWFTSMAAKAGCRLSRLGQAAPVIGASSQWLVAGDFGYLGVSTNESNRRPERLKKLSELLLRMGAASRKAHLRYFSTSNTHAFPHIARTACENSRLWSKAFDIILTGVFAL